MTPAMPLILAPVCHARGCGAAGDQYSMVLCRACRKWFCAAHIDERAGVQRLSADSPSLRGLTYYQGLCRKCRKHHH